MSYRSYRGIAKSKIARSRVLFFIAAVSFTIFAGRLFQLQVLDYGHYSVQAQAKHSLGVEIPARRGEIYTRDNFTNELSLLATNISLDLLFVDPTEIEDPIVVVNQLTPFFFDAQKYREELCNADNECRQALVEETENELWEKLSEMKDEDLEKEYKAELFDKISAQDVTYTVLASGVEFDKAQEIRDLALTGVFVETEEVEEEESEQEENENVAENETGELALDVENILAEATEIVPDEPEQKSQPKSLIWANPLLVRDPINYSLKLAPILEDDVSRLEARLTSRKVRYVKLANKLAPEISEQIEELNLKGVGLIREHWRYYPEGELASQVVGFVSNEGIGQYGVESAFNSELKGRSGLIYAETDRMGRVLQSSNSEILQAEDGKNLVLTIDRSIQAKAEQYLAEEVQHMQADSGQVLIMNPQDGAIIALAEYPSFNPNEYGEVYKKIELYEDEPAKHTMPVFDEEGNKIKDLEDYKGRKYVYKNEFGLEVYRMKTILDIYEPGSTFKSLVVAAAINSGVITPHTPFYDGGPVVVDDYTIHNAEHKYYGQIDMIDVLKYSLNTGMTFIAQEMGGALLYEYITNFGFNNRTDIEFEGEEKGQLEYYRKWAPTELATKSFGQGIAVTPIQMVTAYCSLVNGGYLIQPHIIAEKIDSYGNVEKVEKEIIRRVITEETSETITAMLVNSVESGVAKNAKIKGYLVGGKTGTAQIAKNGIYEKGVGSTIGSFVGFAPADDPRFVVLVKMDRPRSTEWGSASSIPLFKKITEFMLNYYGIMPNENGVDWKLTNSQ